MRKILIFYTCILLYAVFIKDNVTIDGFKNMVLEFRNNNYKRVNFDILSTIKNQLSTLDKKSLLNLLGNTVPFIIYGVIFKLTFIEQSNKMLCLAPFLLVLLIEMTQYILFIGTFDVDDILLNYSSILIGFFIIVCIKKLMRNHFISKKL